MSRLARDIDGAGHFKGSAHVLTSGHSINFISLPLVSVASDASRTVVAWGLHRGKTERITGAIDGPDGWSSSKVFYSRRATKVAPFVVQLANDVQGRVLVSVQSWASGTTMLRGLRGGSQQWQPVIAPQTADDSALAKRDGATLASVNGTITAAWQNSGALVVSTSPRFFSDGTRAAIVWPDQSVAWASVRE